LSIASFLDELRSRDIRLSADGDRLRCSAPAGGLTPQLREQLQRRKVEILRFLHIVETIARQPEAIVPLQPHGARIPVFALAGHNGDVFSFRDLARHLGEDQPFFGLEPPGLDGHREPLKSVEELAAYFASQIRSFRPRGPYIIAGYCAGGAAAFELARQMQQNGAEIPLLALFACPHPTVYRFSLSYWGKRVVKHTQVLSTLKSFEDWRGYVADRIHARLKQLRQERTPPATDPVSMAKFHLEQATMAAVRRYTPGPYSGRVCLLLPNRECLRAGGTALRWRSAAPRTEAYCGPDSVDPERLLLDPHAPAIAAMFKACRG
jgi:thioesterase domain-containing protein